MLWLAILGSVVSLIGGSIVLVSCPPVLQDITPNRLRGRAQALFHVLSIALGLGVGPTAVALVTDHVFHDTAKLRCSMMVVQLPALLLG